MGGVGLPPLEQLARRHLRVLGLHEHGLRVGAPQDRRLTGVGRVAGDGTLHDLLVVPRALGVAAGAVALRHPCGQLSERRPHHVGAPVPQQEQRLRLPRGQCAAQRRDRPRPGVVAARRAAVLQARGHQAQQVLLVGGQRRRSGSRVGVGVGAGGGGRSAVRLEHRGDALGDG